MKILFIGLMFFSFLGSAHAVEDAKSQKTQIRQSAMEAAIWGIPLVSFDAMRQAYFRDAGAHYNDIVYWSLPSDWKNQTTTPNSTSLYIYVNFNTKNGPVVIDVPSSKRDDVRLFGTALNAWQTPLTDVGPRGADKGAGAQYLILPPGYKNFVPSKYTPIASETYNGYLLFRVTPKSDAEADRAKAVGWIKNLRVYTMNEPPEKQKFINMAGRLFDGLVPFDSSFYASLNRMIQEEPELSSLDQNMKYQLIGLGIEKGKTYNPSLDTRMIFTSAINDAHERFKQNLASTIQPWSPDAQWGLGTSAVIGRDTKFSFRSGDSIDVNARGDLYYLAYAPPVTLGAATFYLAAVRDAQGRNLQGGNFYTLHVPADVPAGEYWSVNVYDISTAAFIRKAPVVGVDSFNKFTKKNRDGSIDLYFGPTAPTGLANNWVYTEPGKQWFAFFRLYGPKRDFFEKKWTLPDIQRAPTMSRTSLSAR